MGRRINNKDLFEIEQLFQPQIDSGKGFVTVLEEIKQSIRTLAQASKDKMRVIDPADVDSLKQLGEEIRKTNTLQKQFNDTSQQEAKLRKQIRELEDDQVKAKQRFLKANADQRRAIKQQIQIEQALGFAISNNAQLINNLSRIEQQEVKTKNQAVAVNKALRSVIGDLNPEIQEEADALKRVNALVNRNSKFIKQNSDEVLKAKQNVGNYTSVWKGVGATLRNVAGALGITAGIAGLTRVVGRSINVIRDFELANTQLAAVLGTTSDQTEELTKDAERLGGTTVKTASEVTELQIAYARLGFSQTEIIDLTESTLNASIALNAGLGETANLVGAVVNTFSDFSSTDAPEIADVLAASTAKSALEFEKLETALPIVSGAANAAGVSFNQLVALLGKLSDSGIDASSSATALRNIFIESAAQGLNYEEILEKITGSQDKLTAANDEFGKRAAVSATVLAENIQATSELEAELDKAGGTAERVATQQIETLDGSIKLVVSAWESFVLSLNDGNGTADALRKTLTFVAENLRSLIKIVVAGTSAFIAYKAGVIASRIATTAYSAAVAIATKNTRLFNNAIKANPIGLVTSLIATAIVYFTDFGDTQEDVEEKTRDTNAELERQGEIIEGLTVATIDYLLSVGRTAEVSTKQLQGAIQAANKELINTSDVLDDVTKAAVRSFRIIANESDEDFQKRVIANFDTEQKLRADQFNAAVQFFQARRNLLDLEARLEKRQSFVSEELEKNTAEARETRLKEVIRLIKENNAERERLLNTEEDASSKEFKILEDRARALIAEKAILEDILALKEAQFKQAESADAAIKKIDDDRLAREEAAARVVQENFQQETDLANRSAKRRQELLLSSEKTNEEVNKAVIESNIKSFEEQIEIAKAHNKDTLDLELQLAQSKRRLNDVIAAEEKKRQSEQVAAALATAQAIADIFERQREKREEELNKELEASENQQKRLQEIADRGNIEAERSIASELKRQAEIEREQQALLRRQQVQEFALSAFKTYGAKVDAGEENALGSTITDLSVLSAFVASLPTFYEGTATTVAEALGAPHMAGRDGYIIRADGSEKILNPEISAMTGDATTEEIGQVMKMYNQGVLKRVEPSVFVTTDNSDLAAQMGELKKELIAIKRKQTPEFNYDALSDVIITSLKKGNTLERRMEKNRRYF